MQLRATVTYRRFPKLLNNTVLERLPDTFSTALKDDQDGILNVHSKPLVVPGRDDAITFRGVLETKESERLSIVVKVACDHEQFQRLLEVGRLYAGKLLDTTNPYVPYCYGAYKVTSMIENNAGEQAVGCLVLEDCGRPVTLGSRLMTDLLKIRFFNAVLRAHDAGVNKIISDDEHFFIVQGRPRLIGFTNVAQDHVCRKPGNDIALPPYGAVAPDCEVDQFPRCEEIWALAEALDIWKPNYFQCDAFGGQYYSVDEYLGNAFHLADQRPDGMSRGDGLRGAIDAICLYLDSYHPEVIEDYRYLVERHLDDWVRTYEDENLAKRIMQTPLSELGTTSRVVRSVVNRGSDGRRV